MCLSHAMYAQGDAESNTTTYGQLWNEFNSSNAINDKLTYQFDAQVNFSSDTNKRNFNIVQHFVQYGFRGWIHYYITPRIKLSAALAMWHNRDSPEAGQYDYNEIRSAFQLTHYVVLRKATISNRFRAEQRFVENEARTTYDFKPRFRYAPKVVYALNGNVIREKTYYAMLMDELFLTPDEDRFLRQNKLIMGIGYSFTDDVVLELSYTYQMKFNNGSPNELTNGIGVTLSVNNIFKPKGKKKE